MLNCNAYCWLKTAQLHDPFDLHLTSLVTYLHAYLFTYTRSLQDTGIPMRPYEIKIFVNAALSAVALTMCYDDNNRTFIDVVWRLPLTENSL